MHANIVTVSPVSGKADLKAFVDLPWSIYANDPNWVPPLKSEVYGLITPGKNPWFEHGEAQYFLCRRAGEVTGRISAHIDHLPLTISVEHDMDPGTGNLGLLGAKDETRATALIRTAVHCLRDQGQNHGLGPLSITIL